MSITQETLFSAIQNGQVAHAVLITGERGAGKRETARRCAQMLLCTGSPKPCGACTGCRLLAADAHPDMLYIAAQKGTIRIEAVRKIIGELAKKPYGDSFRVVLMENAQEMTAQAQNCLLKTLEEPPERTVFLLTCIREQELLPTVVSRCRVARVTGEGEAALKERLQAELRMDAPTAALYARLGRGHYGRALQWAKTDGLMALRQNLWSLLIGLCETGSDPLQGYALFKENTGDTDLILSILADILTDILQHRQGAAPLNTDHARDVEYLSKRFSGPGLQRGMEHIVRACALLERNVHHQMLMEDLILKLKDALEVPIDGESNRRAL